MSLRSAEELAALMPVPNQVQLHQTRFRRELVSHWGIPSGARVLEIGCGQGDTTLVLADAVGPTGHVLAVDLANQNYGAPLTLGESTDHLKRGPLGDRMSFQFECDALAATFKQEEFDYVVMAHCTWYFSNLEILQDTLNRIQPWAPRLCLSEWTLEPETPDQMAHFLAILIQGQIESFKEESESNVRSPYAKQTVDLLLTNAGYEVESEARIDTSELEDARWEVTAALAEPTDVLSDRLKSFVSNQIQLLRDWKGPIRSLSSYSLVAKKKAPG